MSKESKKVYPCIRCTQEQYEKQIRDNLLEMGYRESHFTPSKKYRSYITTNFMGSPGRIGGGTRYIEWPNRRLYKSIPTFLAAAMEIAIGNRWYKPELDDPVDSSSTIDWEQRRYEIAKAVMAAYDANPNAAGDPWKRAERAVLEADALIAELKK